MAKYIIAFMVLILLVLENSSIFKRLCVQSLPSSRHDTTTQMRHQLRSHQQMHRESMNSPRSSHHYHRHKRIRHIHQTHKSNAQNLHLNLNRESNADSNIEGEERLAKHLLRHRLHQMEHLQHHREHFQRRTRSSTDYDKYAELRSMPHPWMQLVRDDENMYADEPMMSNEDNTDSALPVDEGFNDVPFPEMTFDDEFNERQDDTDDSGSIDIPFDVEESHNHNHNLNHNRNSNRHSSEYRCPKCEVARKVEHITEEELTRLRIEFVKTQILEKLRLKERPNVSAVTLPKPIQEGVTIDQGGDNSKNKELDDYYARTSKKFIFLERETRECERTGVQRSICFSFKIDDADADGFDVNTAVLWIFVNKMKTKRITPTKTANIHNSNNTLRNQETIVVSEVQQPVDLKFRPIVKTIAIQTVVEQDKWLEIDIEWPIKRWFGNHDLSHLIQISCESCDISEIDRFDKDYRPFIMIDTQNRRRASRQKRGINCTDGVTECCREKLYISFDEIGWGDWIIQPRGYDAYFCRGSCGSVASITQSSSHHSTFLQKVVAMNRNKGREPLELIPCCTAKQYSSLQLVFMDSNNTATQKTFPNMVIESCGCR